MKEYNYNELSSLISEASRSKSIDDRFTESMDRIARLIDLIKSMEYSGIPSSGLYSGVGKLGLEGDGRCPESNYLTLRTHQGSKLSVEVLYEPDGGPVMGGEISYDGAKILEGALKEEFLSQLEILEAKVNKYIRDYEEFVRDPRRFNSLYSRVIYTTVKELRSHDISCNILDSDPRNEYIHIPNIGDKFSAEIKLVAGCLKVKYQFKDSSERIRTRYEFIDLTEENYLSQLMEIISKGVKRA